MKLCIHCKFYKAGRARVQDDICLHEKAKTRPEDLIYNGVREALELPASVQYYACGPMRMGICGPDADLFEEAT